MRVFLSVVFLLIIAASINALPATYTDETSGWTDFIVSYHYFFGPEKPVWSFEFCTFGKDMTWIDSNNLGFGMTIAISMDMLLMTINSACYFEPFHAENLAIPLKMRAGVNMFSESLFFASLTTGVELFLGNWTGFYEYDPDEAFCFNLGITGGLYYSGLKFHPTLEALAGFSTANAYSPSSMVYY